MNYLLRLCAGLLIMCWLSVSVSAQTVISPQTPLQVYVSILPQKYFVNRVAGDLVRADVLVRPGKSPATYSPSPDQIRKLTNSDVYFRIGVPFENGFLHKIKDIAKKIQVVDTRKGIQLRKMQAHVHDHDGDHEDDDHEHELEAADHHEGEDHHDGEHHDGKEHHHHAGGNDPHIWLSPMKVKQQALTICQTLSNLDLAHKADYERNYKSFARDLDALHRDLTQALAPVKGENLFVFHPAFGYFADDYGLHQVAVEQMGKAPKGKELSKIIKLAKKSKTRVIFVQPQFDQNSAHKIATAIHGAVIPIDPLAEDYLANMRAIGKTVAGHL